jgi:hypothetical protein
MMVADHSALHAADRYEQRWTPILSRSATAAPGRSHAFSAVFGLLDGVSIGVDAKAHADATSATLRERRREGTIMMTR